MYIKLCESSAVEVIGSEFPVTEYKDNLKITKSNYETFAGFVCKSKKLISEYIKLQFNYLDRDVLCNLVDKSIHDALYKSLSSSNLIINTESDVVLYMIKFRYE